MNHNDIVRQSFKKQAEKFVAYHMSKSGIYRLSDSENRSNRRRTCIRSSCRDLYLWQGSGSLCKGYYLSGYDGRNAGTGNQTCRRKSYRKYLLSKW